jgi:hypothetical protein
MDLRHPTRPQEKRSDNPKDRRQLASPAATEPPGDEIDCTMKRLRRTD